MEIEEEAEDEVLLLYLIYCSRESAPFDQAGIDQLVAVAQRSNARHNITGWLVYSCGIFFQWLEGSDIRSVLVDATGDSDDPKCAGTLRLLLDELDRARRSPLRPPVQPRGAGAAVRLRCCSTRTSLEANANLLSDIKVIRLIEIGE